MCFPMKSMHYQHGFFLGLQIQFSFNFMSVKSDKNFFSCQVPSQQSLILFKHQVVLFHKTVNLYTSLKVLLLRGQGGLNLGQVSNIRGLRSLAILIYCGFDLLHRLSVCCSPYLHLAGTALVIICKMLVYLSPPWTFKCIPHSLRIV